MTQYWYLNVATREVGFSYTELEENGLLVIISAGCKEDLLDKGYFNIGEIT